MSTYTELRLTDGTTVRFEMVAADSEDADLAPRPDADLPLDADQLDADQLDADQPLDEDLAPDEDLPAGMGRTVPVARGRRRAPALAVGALRTVLRPLGPLLQEVHDSIVGAENPPQQVNVTFGVEVGQDLTLGVVGAASKAVLTVSATWEPTPGIPRIPRPPGAETAAPQAG